MKGCWSCGSHGECYEDCECAKCVDPVDYDNWRTENPEDYADWLESQRLDEDDECDCPSCRDDW